VNAEGASTQIRSMTAGDLQRVVELAAALPEAPQWPESAYRQALRMESSPRRVALIAEDGRASLTGFAIASLLLPQAELETIAVAAESRRRGVGRRLFSALATHLRAEGASEIWLEVRASNQPAIAFYRSLGFVQTGLRRGYYADPIEDAVQMALRSN